MNRPEDVQGAFYSDDTLVAPISPLAHLHKEAASHQEITVVDIVPQPSPSSDPNEKQPNSKHDHAVVGIELVAPDDPYYVEDLVYDRSEEARVIRILDMRLLPWILLTCLVLSMDKTNHSNAISDNLPQDLGFNINTVNEGAAIFSTLYFLFCFTGSIIAKHLGPHRWVPILMFAWGIVTMGHIFIQNKPGYLAARACIAITEAGVIPAILVYFGQFYTGNEYATRVAWVYGIQTIGSAVSGLMASGLLRLHGVRNLQGWRWLFLVDGVITLLVSFATWFYLPLSAAHTAGGIRGFKPWFTDRQVQIAVTRILRDDPAKRHFHKPIEWSDVVDCLRDAGLWGHIAIATVGLTPLTSLHMYFPLTIKSFHFNVFVANALTAPPHFLQCLSTVLLIRHSDKVIERGYHGALAVCWQLVGWILLRVLPSRTPRGIRYAAAIVVGSWPLFHPLNVAWMAENAGTMNKRTITLGALSGFAHLHGIWGSQIYRQDDFPDFHRGNTINISCAGTTLLGWLALKAYYRYRNAKNADALARLSPEERAAEEQAQESKGNRSVLFKFIT